MTDSETSNSAPTSTIVGAWLALLASIVCAIVWLQPHAGRGWMVGALAGAILWAAFWLDYLQRRIEGRLG